MNEQKIKDVISDQVFFNDINSEYLELLVKHASNPTFKKGHFLLTKDQEANTFYLIVHGKVAIESNESGNDPIVVQILGPGEILGTSWLVPPHVWQFDAIALEDTHVISFDGKEIRNMCEENHDFGYDIIKRFTCVITYRLLYTRTKLMDNSL